MPEAIEARYGVLAETACCLSCGNAAARIDATSGQVCVDLGSGRGTDVLRLAELVGSSGHAYGVDITDAMLERARSTAKKLGIANATFLKAELEALPFEGSTVDWVTSNCVLNHARDKAAVWREIARILKPGGQFIVSDIYAVEEIAEEYRNDPEKVAECWAGAITRDEYLRVLAEAGFSDTTILEESAPYDKGQAKVASITIAGTLPGASSSGKRRSSCCG